MVGDARSNQRTPQHGSRIALPPPRGNRIAEDSAGKGAGATRCFIFASRLDPLERSEHLDRLKIGDRHGGDWLELLEEPVRLHRRRIGSPLGDRLVDILLGDVAERVSSIKLRDQLLTLALGKRVYAIAQLASGIVAQLPRLCQAHFGVSPQRDTVILSKMPIFEARSEEDTSEHQSLMSISYAVFCLIK